jgi:hypothetical protein
MPWFMKRFRYYLGIDSTFTFRPNNHRMNLWWKVALLSPLAGVNSGARNSENR